MEDTEAFFDVWASVYDADYKDQTIGDLAFYLDLARAADGPVLEVGCGTGRVYLELLTAGVDATGIDVSAAMLNELRERAADRGLSPSVRQADMTDFDPDREYALVIVPFRTFLHNLTVADQQAALRNFRAALAPEGRLALNFFVPDFDVICQQYGELQERVIEEGETTYTVREISEIEHTPDQIVRVTRRLVRDGEVLREGTFRLAFISKRDFTLLLETTGWSEWTVYGGFDREPLAPDSREMVWIAEP